jgi:hypothetical protein
VSGLISSDFISEVLFFAAAMFVFWWTFTKAGDKAVANACVRAGGPVPRPYAAA